jgi:hypothetical protein
MKPGLRLALLAGCVFVAALVSPGAARVAVEDVLGPYRACAAGGALLGAHATTALEPVHRDDHGDARPQIALDAP